MELPAWDRFRALVECPLIVTLALILQPAASAVPAGGQGEGTTEDSPPFKLDDALNTPDWLTISGEARVRFEGISGQFRGNPRLDNADHLFFSRTLLKLEADFDSTAFAVEFLDGRHYGGTDGSQLNTGNVNTTSVLQAYADLKLEDSETTTSRVRVGRQTIDLGSRRLVARNNYRNTINAFTGIDLEWKNETDKLDVFFVLPTRRRPGDFPSVEDNDSEFDAEDSDFTFAGGHFQRALNDRDSVELYAYGILEDERSRYRKHVTPGLRVRRKAALSSADYEFESAVQYGRTQGASGTPKLDHFATFAHASAGYTVDTTWTPRFRVAIDYASGDRDSSDGDSNRFDTLFGARRFEYGPTGIYGAIARSNIISPELRMVLKPRSGVNWMWAYRYLWLASDEDAWTTAGVGDPTGNSSGRVGQQIETRLRWDLQEQKVRLETGMAVMFDGDFQHQAPGGQNSDTVYGYFQARWQF